MTLTHDDLQAIGNLIDTKLDQKLDKKFNEFEVRLTKKMKQETKTIVNFFDKEYLGHDKRIKRLEKHLQLPPIAD